MSQITKTQSELICRKYRLHQGKWDKIMSDKEIKALHYPQNKIQNHVNYKKKRLAMQISPNHDKGKKKRIRVLQKIFKNLPSSETSSSSDYNEVEEEEEEEKEEEEEEKEEKEEEK